jgi:hypothetical protein
MKDRSLLLAQRMMNLYRQAHVVDGGWQAANEIILHDAEPEAIAELLKMPNGNKLAQHIENLRNGSTPKDSIDPDLAPYAGAFLRIGAPEISDKEIVELVDMLQNFSPTQDSLDRLHNSPAIMRFGDDWSRALHGFVAMRPDLSEKIDLAIRTSRAYDLWNSANAALAPPISERAKAQVQADMPEFETYLPMFGDEGSELLEKLRAFVRN